MNDSFVTIASFPNTIEAHAAKNFLETNGFRAFLADEQTALQSWSNYIEVKLQVSAANAQQATALLAQVRAEAGTSNSD